MTKQKLCTQAGTGLILLFAVLACKPAQAEEIVHRLVNQHIKEPIAVQGDRITVVRGNVIVNTEKIFRQNNDEAFMLKICPPGKGTRIIYRSNKIINRGRIIQAGRKHSVASMVFLKKAQSRKATIFSRKNTLLNSGQILNRQQ